MRARRRRDNHEGNYEQRGTRPGKISWDSAAGFQIRAQESAKAARLHRGRGHHARARHRREHGHLLGRQRHPPAPPPLRPPRTPPARLADQPGHHGDRADLAPELPGLARAESGLRGDGRVGLLHDDQVQPDGRRPARAGAVRALLLQPLPDARRQAGARPHLHGPGGGARRRAGRDDQPRPLAAALRRRPELRRQGRHARRQHLHGRRGAAERLPLRQLPEGGRRVGAARPRPVAAPSLRPLDPLPERHRAAQARRQPRAGAVEHGERRAGARRRVPREPEPRGEGRLAGEAGGGRDSPGAPGPDGGRRLCAADRVRQRRQPPALARRQPAEGDGRPRGARRQPAPPHPATARREPAALHPRRHGRVAAGLLGHPLARAHPVQQPEPVRPLQRHGRSGRARPACARLHRPRLAADGPDLRARAGVAGVEG